MSTLAVEMMLRCVYDGCISRLDMNIERRPYHKNCSCALHRVKGVCSGACSQEINITFPKKQSWKDCSLSVSATSKFSPKPSRLGDSSSFRSKDANGALLDA